MAELWKFILLLSMVNCENDERHRLYKRLVMQANDWTKFVHKTVQFDVETKIECGASCNYHLEECDMFIHFQDDILCHIGLFENGNQNFLTGLSGEHPVYLSLGNRKIFSSN